MPHTKAIVRRAPAENFDPPPDLHPVLQRVLSRRKLASADELDYGLDRLLPFTLLHGIGGAVDLLQAALRDDRHIMVVADFDADGATSCALALRALRLMGARRADYLVPNRFEYGYGLTPEIVAVAAARRPDLIITVDNGISSLEGVRRAQQLGIGVLVTDHHLPAEALPEADAIVNPNQPGDAFPSKHLAGVGVIFYVMLALRARLRAAGWFEGQGIAEPNLAQLLDLVALGTVADVVPLDHNNRILVAQGLARIRAGRCCPGIAALAAVAGRRLERLVSADLGFALAPRLNAAGRLEDMGLGIECLLCDEADAARDLAQRMDTLNRERRGIEAEMQAQALADLARMEFDDRDGALPVGLCLFDPEWHQGVIGILASRIKERLHRPVIAFAPGGDGEIKGSARSVSGVHIRDVLDAVAAHHPGLLTKFGGHAAAAGLTLREADLAAFRAAFDAEVRRHLAPEDLRGVVLSDGALSPEELNLELAEALRAAGPWGQGFPEPMFDGVFEVASRRIVGERHLKLTLRVPDGTHCIDAIAFHTDDSAWPAGAARIEAAYRLDVNEYQGLRTPQLIVEYLRLL